MVSKGMVTFLETRYWWEVGSNSKEDPSSLKMLPIAVNGFKNFVFQVADGEKSWKNKTVLLNRKKRGEGKVRGEEGTEDLGQQGKEQGKGR